MTWPKRGCGGVNMDSEILPEEKLLNLIRNEKQNGVGQDFKTQRNTESHVEKKKRASLLLAINRLLLLSVLLLLGYFGHDFFIKEEKISDDLVDIGIESKVMPSEPAVFFYEPKPFLDYEELFQKRDIFEQPQETVEVEPVRVDLLKNFRLVGIVLGETSEAIVEEIQNKRTLFVREGDYIDEMKVLSIKEGRVILTYQEEELELVQ